MKLKTKFQDEDFDLGEVVDVNIATMPDGRIKAQAIAEAGKIRTFFYEKLETFWNDWEDYEEPKRYWFIDAFGNIVQNEITKHYGDEYTDMTATYENQKQIGNYFETPEEAEKAVEKLKAWKRLKDKGFKFCCDIEYESLCGNGFNIPLNAIMPPEAYTDTEVSKDLDLLFGGEE